MMAGPLWWSPSEMYWDPHRQNCSVSLTIPVQKCQEDKVVLDALADGHRNLAPGLPLGSRLSPADTHVACPLWSRGEGYLGVQLLLDSEGCFSVKTHRWEKPRPSSPTLDCRGEKRLHQVAFFFFF